MERKHILARHTPESLNSLTLFAMGAKFKKANGLPKAGKAISPTTIYPRAYSVVGYDQTIRCVAVQQFDIVVPLRVLLNFRLICIITISFVARRLSTTVD